jgi:hypothetical protein
MFTKPTTSIVSIDWALESISAGVCEAHKRFMGKLLQNGVRGVLKPERGGRDAFERRMW